MALTDRAILNLKPKEKRYDLSDGANYGGGNLLMRVQPGGGRYFIYRTKVNGKDRQITLGKYPELTLSAARIKAAEYGEQRQEGIDPASLPAFELEQMTLAHLAGEYLERWAKPKKKSWESDQRYLDRDVLPRIGNVRLSDFRRAHIRPLLDEKIQNGSPMAANMMLAIVRKMLNWAVENDYMAANPLASMAQPQSPRSKDLVLSEREIRVFWGKYTNTDARVRISLTTALALRMILVTAQRPGEVAGMEWSELDGDWWNLPAERAKNKLAHRIPLNRMALEILALMKEIRCNNVVFPTTRYASRLGRHMSMGTMGDAISRQMKRETNPMPWFTPHDLRRTAASHMASMGTPPLVISRLLNHKEGGITQIYNRYSYDVEKREAMDKWADRITDMVSGDE